MLQYILSEDGGPVEPVRVRRWGPAKLVFEAATPGVPASITVRFKTADTLWAIGCCWELLRWCIRPPYAALQALTVDHVPQPQLLAVLHS